MIDKSGELWRFQCEIRSVRRMGEQAQISYLEAVKKARGAAGLKKLMDGLDNRAEPPKDLF